MAVHPPTLLLLLTAALLGTDAQIALSGTRITIGLSNTLVPVKLYTDRRLNTPQDGQGVVLSLQACLALCVIQGSASCKGVDYNPAFNPPDSNCWLHNTCSTQTSLYNSQTGYTHYKLTQICDPVQRVVRFEGRMVSERAEGVVFSGADSVAACGLACNLDPGCVSADYSSSTCTLFSSSSGELPSQQCLPTSVTASSTLYTRPCIAAGGFSSLRPGAVYDAALDSPTTSDFFSCLSLCSDTSTCLGVQYSTEAEFDGEQVSTRCQQYVSTPVSTLCAAPTADINIYSVIKTSCRDLSSFYVSREDTQYVSLSDVSLTTFSSRRECGEQCVGSPSCAAFVFDHNSNQCYHNHDEVHECETAVFRVEIGVTHTRLYSSCRRQEWDVRRNSQLAGVTPVSAATFEECLSECGVQAACMGVVWDLETASCSLQLGSDSACQVLPTADTCCYTAYRKHRCAAASGFGSSSENVTLSSSNVISNVVSEEACLLRCASSAPSCRAAVYHRDAEVCRLHIATSTTQSLCVLPTTPLSNAVVHYVQSCETSAQFEETMNKRVVGGVRSPAYQTLTGCQQACVQDDRCVGLDWDKEASTASNSRCWLHYESNGGCEAGRSSTCCNHYQRTPNKCSVISGFSVLRGSRRESGGSLQPLSVSGYTACLSVCTNDAACQGFDISQTNRCSTYSSTSVCGPLTTCTDCTHYRRATYSCMWRFRDSQVPGGSSQVGVTSMLGCEQACRTTVDCQGIDFDANSATPCFLHTASSICNTLQAEVGVQHYRLRTVVCDSDSGLADAQWSNAEQNFNTIGNTLLGAGLSNSAIECLRECSTTPGCHGVDYDKTTARCYMARRSNACRGGNPNTCCDRLLLPDSCTAPAQSGYSVTSRQHRLSGRLRPGVTTLASCAALCTADTHCAAFDYDRSAECWTHSSTNECSNEKKLFTHDCCDHYVKTSGCSNYNVPAFIGYDSAPLTHVPGGTAVADLVTEHQCVDRCTSTTSCHSVDFNFQNNVCYIHTRTTGCSTAVHNPKVHRYTKAALTCP